MSTDLKTQIREYVAGVERDQDPITVEEVRLRLDRRDETEPVVGLRRPVESRTPLRRPWPAVVGAVVILVIFGVFVFVFPGDESVPPAESLPDPMERELGYYVPSDVPDGFVLQDVEVNQFIGGSSLTYLRDDDTFWRPDDGGFRIAGPFGSPLGLPENPDEYLSEIVAATPGSSEVEVAGRPGVIYESEYVDGPVATTLVSLVVVDDQGGVYEITASGMSREDVLSIGEGVGRVSVGEYVDLGFGLDWDLMVSDTHEDYEYGVPQQIEDLAMDVDVVLGMDIFRRSRFARSGSEETTVITTEDGSVVQSEEGPRGSRSVNLYLDVEDLDVRSVASRLEDRFPALTYSPEVIETLTDEYIQEVRNGAVLAEDPHVIQAPTGPEPQFDPSDLGEELPLEPARSPDVIPETLFRGRSGNVPVATEGRPIIVLGTIRQPGSDVEAVTMLLWFTETPGVNNGLAAGESLGGGGGSYPLNRYGVGVRSYTETEGSTEVVGEMTYSVPLETSVVQIVTGSDSYWQRPAGGYGAISWGDTVDEPTTLIAFDAEGDQLGEWEVPPR